MKIISKPKWICKHIGFSLLIIGCVILPFQIILKLDFPLSLIIFPLSLIFQFIGWNEPIFFLTDKWVKKKYEKEN